jgi:hypothetical protein
MNGKTRAYIIELLSKKITGLITWTEGQIKDIPSPAVNELEIASAALVEVARNGKTADNGAAAFLALDVIVTGEQFLIELDSRFANGNAKNSPAHEFVLKLLDIVAKVTPTPPIPTGLPPVVRP